MVGDQEVLELEEGDAAGDDDGAVALAVHEGAGTGSHLVCGFAADDGGGLAQRLAAVQQLHDERVAGGGHRARTPVAGQDQGVAVDPVHVLLAVRQGEPAVHEAAGGEVELAHRHRVLAAVRQGEQTARLRRPLAGGAFPDPVGALGLGQGVEVQHGAPVRRRRGVVGDAGGAPEAADVVGVLPEVEHLAAEEVRAGNAVLGLGEFERLGVQAGVAGVAFQHLQRAGVLLVHPGQRAFAAYVLQPEVGVGGGGLGVGGLQRRALGRRRRGLGRGRGGGGGQGEGRKQEGEEKRAHGHPGRDDGAA